MAIELNRIGWEDAPSEASPIDSGNLKQMENNTEDAINKLETKLQGQLDLLTPEILWTGDTNDVSEITLAKNINNFTRLKVYFHDNNGQYLSAEAYNNKTTERYIPLYTVFNNDSYHLLKFKGIRINGNEVENNGIFTFNFADKTINYNNEISITRIEGYKI